MITVQALITLVIQLIVAGLIFWLLWWLIHYTNPPQPFKKVATVVLAILAVLCVCVMLLRLTGAGPFVIP